MKNLFLVLSISLIFFANSANARVLNYNQMQVVKREMPTAVLIDVRPAKEFDGPSIPGSTRIDINKLTAENLLAAVGTKSTPIIFYCSSPTSPYSGKAIDKAMSWGFMNVFRYSGGISEYNSKMSVR
jgi:rhodanese-related sulfurtransferase